MNTMVARATEPGTESIVALRPASAAEPAILARVAAGHAASVVDCYGIGKAPRCLAGFETICQWCRHFASIRSTRRP